MGDTFSTRRWLAVLVAGAALSWSGFVTAVGAQDAPLAELEAAARASVDFDPWQIQEDEIEPRLEAAQEYLDWALDEAATTAADRAETERALVAANDVLDAARAHRQAMEIEVENYSISIWFLGDLGLQETYDSEAERARHAEPLAAATESLIERVESADRAVANAEAAVAAVEVVLAERVALDEAAQLVARRAAQIDARLGAMITARSEALDRWTHEILAEEREEAVLVTITSVEVQVPIDVPVDRPAATGEQNQEDAPAGEDVPDAPIPTVTTVVAIPPILVNEEIAGQVRALIGAARSDGIDLHGSGFRPREDQITLRIAHCGTSGFDIFERPAGECTPPTARPGTSEHEHGLAVDFTVDGGIVTWESPAFTWLSANAGSYGLINLPSEAWHWSTTGG